MKKLLTVLLAVTCFFVFISVTSAVEDKAKRPLPQKQPLRQPAAPAFNVVLGSITKINTADPTKPTIEVKSDTKDSSIHVIEMTPFTNVAKMTDISELKAGDEVRVMTRKVENKEVAINVVFGKIKNMPAPRPAMQGRIPPPVAQKPVKK